MEILFVGLAKKFKVVRDVHVEDCLVQVAGRRANKSFDERHVFYLTREAVKEGVSGAFAGLAELLACREVPLIEPNGYKCGKTG